MIQPELTKKISSEKRKPKNPIKFQVQLNEEQKEAKAVILNNTITLLTGKAGSGKTLLACQIALDALFNREVEKIIITRPVVTAKEEIGFLPGNIKDKLDPFVAPIFDNLYRLYSKEKIDKIVQDGELEIIPVAFMRGRNFTNCYAILDEAQNTTPEQMKMFLTRIGFGSKTVITGDITQIDLAKGQKSGLIEAKKILSKVKGIAFTHFLSEDVVRHPLVQKIINAYENFEKKESK